MNMSGTALYEGCVVLFVAQVFGVHLGLAQQTTLVFLSVLSAVAVAAIPGGSLPLIAGLLVAFGIPPEGIGIILGVDRILDMTRTMTNVGSDLVTTAVVDAGQRKQYGEVAPRYNPRLAHDSREARAAVCLRVKGLFWASLAVRCTMDALRNILVLMDPGAESQPAFDAAMVLAKRYGSRLELLIGVFQDLHVSLLRADDGHGAGVPRRDHGRPPRHDRALREVAARRRGQRPG